MVQHIDTIPIEYLHPFYISKYITKKTGIFKKQTNKVKVNTHLDFDEMESKGYSKWVRYNMKLRFEESSRYSSTPDISGVNSIEYTLKRFCDKLINIDKLPYCKIISVIPDGDNYICVVWDGYEERK